MCRKPKRWLTDNKVLLNEEKTEAILFRSSGPVTSTVNNGGSVAQLKPTVRDIGVVLDTRPDMASQVLTDCRSAYYHLFRIAKIRSSLTIVACKTLVHALVISRLGYGNALLYGITDRLLHRLEIIQHSAAMIITYQETRSAKHNGGASTTTLVTREMAYQLQDSCTRVPRPSWYGACVRINAHYAILTTLRPNW